MTKQTDAIALALKHAAPSFLSPGWTLVRSEDIEALQDAQTEKPTQQGSVNQRAHETALRQWEHCKQYALELQERLVKYEGGAPMVLNAAPQPAQQEPVAIVAVDGIGQIQIGWMKKPQHNDKLYTSPQPAQRKPLTDEQILDMAEGCTAQYHDLLNFARAIEAAHDIKE